MWKGGVSFEPYSKNWTKNLKESIRQRDQYLCQICYIDQRELSTKLSIHHIDYNKKNCTPNNLISLCNPCHMKTNAKRDLWPNFFFKLMNRKIRGNLCASL
jgi:5-methylcytosine-specific restriction endonuclease McrA